MKARSALLVIPCLALALATIASTAGCGATAATTIGDSDGGTGGGGGGGSGGDAGGRADGSFDAGPPTGDSGDSFACGSATCGATQYCLHPCCGGPAPQCTETDDAGTCPPGFHPASCGGGLQGGCEADPCVPAPPKCVDDPNAMPGCKRNKGSRDLMCLCA